MRRSLRETSSSRFLLRVGLFGSAPVSLARRLLLPSRLPQSRCLNSIPPVAAKARSQGRAGCFLLASPGRRGQSSSAPRAVSRPRLGVGVGGRRGGGGGGVRGGAVPLLEPVPASAPGSRTPRGKKEEWRVRSRGFLIQPGAAGGRRSFGAAGRPSLPGSSRSSAPGTCRLSLAETRSGGGESRLGPPLTGGATPAGGRAAAAVSASPRGS